MSMGALSCAGAVPVVAHKAPIAQNAAVMLEVNLRPKCPMGPFVSMALILELYKMHAMPGTEGPRLGHHVLDNNSGRSDACRGVTFPATAFASATP
jgi:hypothetical protein